MKDAWKNAKDKTKMNTQTILWIAMIAHHWPSIRAEEKPNSLSYLTRFGYLTPNPNGMAQISSDQLKNAVSSLQFMAGLNITGEVDDKTLNLMAKPRCGVPDISFNDFRNRRRRKRKKRYTLQGQKWFHKNLTWSLESWPRYLDPTKVRRALTSALELWARDSSLTFQEVSPHFEDGKRGRDYSDIRVSFLQGNHDDGYPFDGPGSVLAHAFFPGTGRGGDIHFDMDETWSAGERNMEEEITSIFAVSAHEFGHSLGLSHSNVQESLMFPWYSGVPESNRLPVDDREAVQRLYGKGMKVNYEFDYEEKVPTKNEPETKKNDTRIDREKERERQRVYPPDKCNTTFDAVAVIRSEMWAFKGKYFWRLDKDGRDHYSHQEPVLLSAFWYGLPDINRIENVDAVYERPDHKIVFFIGKNYYVLTGNSQLEQGPSPITRLGISETVEKIDGVMRWGWNDETYIFSGSEYWKFDERIQHVELDYPRSISIWKGVPGNIDSVFSYTDGNTYFFKGQFFWTFDDVRMRVVDEKPLLIHRHWTKCGPPSEIRNPFHSSIEEVPSVLGGTSNSASNAFVYFPITLFSIVLVFR